MAYPDNPEFIDFVDERSEPAEIENEEHSISAGAYKYSLCEVPDTEYSISCTGDVNGTFTVSFTDTAPGPGSVYVNPLNGNVLHCATDAPDDLTWSYWGRGTANNKRMLEQYREPIIDVHRVAGQLWVSATSPASSSVNISKANCQIAGQLVEYNGGTLSFSSVTFENPGWTKPLRVVLEVSGAVGFSEGYEAASRSVCGNPPAVPESKTLAIVFLQDSVNVSDENIVNTFIEAPYDTGDPSGHGTGDVSKYQYGSGVLSGDAVCICGPSMVGRADADDDSAVPGVGFVEEILDEAFCTVRSSGVFDFDNKTTSYDSLIYGQQAYLSTATGRITQTRNKTPGEWDQCMGIALSSTKIKIQIGDARKNVKGDDPEPGNYKFKAGVAHGEFVRRCIDEPDTVDEAKANAAATMAAIGIVIAAPGASYCQVGMPDYVWIVDDHDGLCPGGLTPSSKGTIFYISTTIEGEAVPTRSITAGHLVQEACIQLDDAGAEYRIICGPATIIGGGGDDPEQWFDVDCDSEVSVGDAIYLDGSSIGHRTVATDDDKKDVIGIIAAVNATNTRCSLVRPPNVYDADSSYVDGEYFLNPWGSPGSWAKGVIFGPGQWKVRVGWGRGGDPGGVLVDIHNYGKQGGGGDDDGNEIGQVHGIFWSETMISEGVAVDMDVTSDWVCPASWEQHTLLRGICKSCVENPNYEEGENGPFIAEVVMKGLYKHPSRTFTAGGAYYVSGTAGDYQPIISFGKELKSIGQVWAAGTNQIDVSPVNLGVVLVDLGDPVPVEAFDNTVSGYKPYPKAFEKMRGHDGTSSSSKADSDFTANEWLLEAPTVIDTVDFSVESTGDGAGAYLECDLCTGSGTSILTSKARLVTDSEARGDTIPSSANSSGHTRAVVTKGLMPLNPGQTLYWKYERKGIFTTDPYGVVVVANKYLVSPSS
ncbi:hypothetical protein J7M28_04725 [bacterium]|nr:hypothetical protein [bacterium]